MKATIYSKDACPFCVRAKRLFEQKGIAYEEINGPANKDELVNRVTAISGRPPSTLPQIWVGDDYVGGYAELVEFLKKPA